VFGTESGETGVAGARNNFDDVDDYDSLNETTKIATRAGADIPKTKGLSRNVVVELVQPGAVSTLAGSDQGVRRITVSVLQDGAVIAKRIAYRTAAPE
jgi:hypothetical protein